MASANDLIVQLFVEHHVDVLRVAAGTSNEVQGVLGSLENDIRYLLGSTDLAGGERVALDRLLHDVNAAISNRYTGVRDFVRSHMAELVRAEGKTTADIINRGIGAGLANGTLSDMVVEAASTDVMIHGAVNADWWMRQSDDLQWRFAQQVRSGIAAGETNQQIVNRILGMEGANGVLFRTRANAEALVNTAMSSAASAARMEVYRQNADILRGIMQISTLDERTTDTCIAYDHQSWDLEGNPLTKDGLPYAGGVPRHWNCRSIEVPLLKHWNETGNLADRLTPAQRAGMLGDVPGELKLADFLAGKTKAQTDAIFGVGRIELWRKGKLTFTDLMNQRGRGITMDAFAALASRM